MSDADTHADTEATSKYETPIRQKHARRIIAGMIYSPQHEDNGFRYSTADEIADTFIESLNTHAHPPTNADAKVVATISIPIHRSLTDNRCLDLFDYTHRKFTKFGHTDDGNPYVEFDGDVNGKTINFSIKVDPQV